MTIEIEAWELPRKAFWATSVQGKLRCPECKSIVVELWNKDFSELNYKCSNQWCDWQKEIDLSKRELLCQT